MLLCSTWSLSACHQVAGDTIGSQTTGVTKDERKQTAHGRGGVSAEMLTFSMSIVTISNSDAQQTAMAADVH
jgi:hypothetical protein